MYAETKTEAMHTAIDETNRRRAIQSKYNREHGIEPAGIIKSVRDLTERVAAAAETPPQYHPSDDAQLSERELRKLIADLETQMRSAAEALEFEQAAMLRDRIYDLRHTLVDLDADIPAWERARALAGEGVRRRSSVV